MSPTSGPAALAALVRDAPPAPLPRAQPSPARRAIKLAYQDELERKAEAGSALGLLWFALLLAGAIMGPAWLLRGPRWLGAIVGTITVVAVIVFSRRGQAIARDREARLAAALAEPGVPVDGLLDWLTADRPLADLHLRAPIEPALLEAAVRTIDPGASITWPAPATARLALTPRVLRAARHRHAAVHGGDLPRLRAVLAQVVAPLVRDPGVVRLELGGEVDGDARGPV